MVLASRVSISESHALLILSMSKTFTFSVSHMQMIRRAACAAGSQAGTRKAHVCMNSRTLFCIKSDCAFVSRNCKQCFRQ